MKNIMTDIKDNDQETSTKRKKRPRGFTVLKNEDKLSRLQYEENYAESFMKKLSQKLDENSLHEILSIIEKLESDVDNMKEQYAKIQLLLKEHEDLQREFLGFLESHQALECGKLMMYYEVCSMKQFIRNLMSHFKRQPQFLKKLIDKLCGLIEHENVQQCTVEEAMAPLLQKNSVLMQQFLRFLPAEKPPDWYFSCDDMWEDFSIDNEVNDDETFDISQTVSEVITGETKSCIYNCKKNNKSSLCPVCNIKFINGRIYVANGKILRPANIIFDPTVETENIRRLCGKSDYFPPTSAKSRHKRIDTCNKDMNEGRLSPFITGAESEEEIAENDLHTRKRRRKNPQRLKVRFKADKKKVSSRSTDQVQADDTADTAASNDEVSCDDTGREDNGYNSCDDSVPVHLISENVSNKEVVELQDMELNISATSMPGPSRGHSIEILKQLKNPRLKTVV